MIALVGDADAASQILVGTVLQMPSLAVGLQSKLALGKQMPPCPRRRRRNNPACGRVALAQRAMQYFLLLLGSVTHLAVPQSLSDRHSRVQ